MLITVIVPTFNEKENISRLIPDLLSEFKKSSHEFHILVVDGNSNDGTQAVVQEASKLNKNVHLLVEREKTGLGGAYTLGMTHAMRELKANALVEMDADYQHDPRELLLLVNKLDEGNDYVIGSRYIKGGSIPKEWELYRKLLSFGASLFTRVVLWIPEVHDITSGYRILRVSALQNIDLSKLEKRGYMYKIQLLYLIHRQGMRVAEVPITFGLRDRGDSKMGLENLTGSLKLVIEMRLREKASFVKFLISGFTGLIVQTSIFYSLVLIYHLDPKTSLIPAFLCAVATTFTLNNVWSFRDRKISDPKTRAIKFVIFCLVNIGSFLIQRSSIALSQNLFSQPKLGVLLVGYPVGILLGLIWNYAFYSRVVWKKN